MPLYNNITNHNLYNSVNCADLFHSHSIVPQPRKGLFLFIKLLTPPYFSRQPYRQKLWLLFSLGNFGHRQKSPIALNRQELPLLVRF